MPKPTRTDGPSSLAPTVLDRAPLASAGHGEDIALRLRRTKLVGLGFAAVAVLAGAFAFRCAASQASLRTMTSANEAALAARPRLPPPPAAVPLSSSLRAAPSAALEIESDPPEPAVSAASAASPTPSKPSGKENVKPKRTGPPHKVKRRQARP